MDCEKFDPLFVEELYRELDDFTSAALRRHVAGCDRCTSVLESLRSTRERTRLAGVFAAPDLEGRILAKLKEAKRAEPVPSRAERVLSWAGSWAMRPQTAMAAVFLLMIGTSAFAIRARQSSERRATVSVLEQGSPAGPRESAGDRESLDSNAAAAAHGAGTPVPQAATSQALGSAGSAVASADLKTGETKAALQEQNARGGVMDGLTGGHGAVSGQAIASALGAGGSADDSNGAGGRGEESAPAPKKSSVGRAEPSDLLNAAASAGADKNERPSKEERFSESSQDSFSAGMAAYRARNFAEAAERFDTAARSGDPNAALWAAKSIKDGPGGCSAALGRFDQISRTSSDSWTGSEAQLESARCEISRGQTVSARERLSRLSNVPSHAAVAQQTLAELANQVASRSEAERAKAGVASPKPSRPASRPAAGSPRVDSAR